MRKNAFNIVFFLLIASGFTFLFYYADKHWIPKPQKPEKPPAQAPEVTPGERRLALQAVAGVAAISGGEARLISETMARLDAEERARKEKRAAALAVAGAAATAVEPRSIPREPAKPTRLIALGDSSYYNQVLLSTLAGGVQQVVLPRFDAADRLGREVKEKDANGKPTKAGVPLYLIPGMPIYRGKYLREDYVPPVLSPGVVADPSLLAEPSYALFHYRTPDDKYPDPELGTVEWDVVSEEHPEGGIHKVVFERSLGAPYFVKIRKVYTLAPRDYHIGLRLEIEALPGREMGKGNLRLQLSGPRGLPIEGDWYTSIYRSAIIGWRDSKGTPRRQYEDAASVAARRGGEVVTKGDNVFNYMVIATQFFASGVAIDDKAAESQAVANPWAYVRATTELPFDKKPNPSMPYFDDVTVRAVFDTIDLPAPGQPGSHITQSYLIYNGPSKVELLGFMEGDRAVDASLVKRYREKLGLETITDFRSDTWLGRFANMIYWTDLVIWFTNVMHWLLASIHSILPNWAVSIVVLTVMVRLLLHYPSKKQTQTNLKMMEVQKKLAPQIEELKKKYPDSPNEFNRAKMQLMMANGVNPFTAMGGCLLLILQMPVMMGLYYCLQESIFFRLEPFLWVNNLAAPDMLFWWGEHIPYISTPEDLGSFIYLGPYFNALPLIAVALMIWQQNKMMPPPTDEQMAQQQRMMKWMMIMVAIMFYKVAAGLALYFIIGTSWGLIERRFIPKAGDKNGDDGGAGETVLASPKSGSPNGTPTSVGPVELPKPKGLLGRLREAVQKRMEEMQKQADENAKRQIRHEKSREVGDQERRERKKKRRK